MEAHSMNIAQQNPPVTAASVTAAVIAVLAAFTDLGTEQVAAIGGVVSILAAFVAQRFTTPA